MHAPRTFEIKKLGLEPIEFIEILESKLDYFQNEVLPKIGSDHRRVPSLVFQSPTDSITSILEQNDSICSLRTVIRKIVHPKTVLTRDDHESCLQKSTQSTVGHTFRLKDYLLKTLLPQLSAFISDSTLNLAPFPLIEPDNVNDHDHSCWEIDNCTFKLSCVHLDLITYSNDAKMKLLGEIFALSFITLMNLTGNSQAAAADLVKYSGWEKWKISACTLASLAALMFVILALLLKINYKYSTYTSSDIYVQDQVIAIILKVFKLY